jgi:hypothetical protein
VDVIRHFAFIGAAESEHDAGPRGGARQVNRANARMRDRAADQNGVQHAREHEIGDELPLAPQQPMVFAPQQRAADIKGAIAAHG